MCDYYYGDVACECVGLDKITVAPNCGASCAARESGKGNYFAWLANVSHFAV